MSEKLTCPGCKGVGVVELPAKTIKEIEAYKKREATKMTIHKFRSEGYSIRELTKLMGYKSTRSVFNILKKGGLDGQH